MFLADFEAEAGTHLEKIESAFLDIATLAEDPNLINAVFRAAHSLKGTAGFFALEKIVAVTHELESVFSLIKDKNLTISEEIADIALQSVDCLKDLIRNINADESIEIKELVENLKKYSSVKEAEETAAEVEIPFNYNDPQISSIIKNASRFGHKAYYVSIGFNRKLGKYYKNPKGMIDNILSIGAIVEVFVKNGESGFRIKSDQDVVQADNIIKALTKRDTATLDLLVTSVLEPDLLSIALEVGKSCIHPLPVNGPPPAASVRKDEKPGASPNGVIQNDVLQNNAIPKTETRKEQTGLPVSPRKSDFSVRLDISTINGLLDLANEMILTRNRLLSTLYGHEKAITGITPVLHDLNILASEIQEKIMLTRMQPISVIFGLFPRIIRDVAKAVNKEIEVEIFGNDVTLDKYLLDSLVDPITQIVKNSADHGLEGAERRTELGKPRKGKITLNAFMRDGSAIIEVKDDGAGIDTEALKRKYIERGAATPEALEAMPKSAILALVLEPGVSTAKQITSLSGRGVGMDIVKTNIEKLGGSIEIDSEINIGTTIRLKMPITLSVMRTLIVKIDSVLYAVPEINIERIVRIWHNTPSKRFERFNDALVLVFNGRIIPVVTMAELDAKTKGRPPPPVDALLEELKGRTVAKCLVLKAGDKVFALLIDDAIRTEQTLIKPLPEYFRNSPCYSSVTVLGNGSAITILNTEGILRLLGIEGAAQNAAGDSAEKESEEDGKDEKSLIVFKCSGEEYFALETEDILRIEVIERDQIQEIDDDHFINIAGKTIRVVRPENYVPVKKSEYTAGKLYLLTLKISSSPAGFLAGKVVDKVRGSFELDNEQLYSDFIFGTSRFNEKIFIMLDSAAIVKDIEKNKQRKRIVKEVV